MAIRPPSASGGGHVSAPSTSSANANEASRESSTPLSHGPLRPRGQGIDSSSQPLQMPRPPAPASVERNTAFLPEDYVRESRRRRDAARPAHLSGSDTPTSGGPLPTSRTWPMMPPAHLGQPSVQSELQDLPSSSLARAPGTWPLTRPQASANGPSNRQSEVRLAGGFRLPHELVQEYRETRAPVAVYESARPNAIQSSPTGLSGVHETPPLILEPNTVPAEALSATPAVEPQLPPDLERLQVPPNPLNPRDVRRHDFGAMPMQTQGSTGQVADGALLDMNAQRQLTVQQRLPQTAPWRLHAAEHAQRDNALLQSGGLTLGESAAHQRPVDAPEPPEPAATAHEDGTLQTLGRGVKKVLSAETTHILLELAAGVGLLGGNFGVRGVDLGTKVARGAMIVGGSASLLTGIGTGLAKFSRRYARTHRETYRLQDLEAGGPNTSAARRAPGTHDAHNIAAAAKPQQPGPLALAPSRMHDAPMPTIASVIQPNPRQLRPEPETVPAAPASSSDESPPQLPTIRELMAQSSIAPAISSQPSGVPVSGRRNAEET